jgi:creatinine amidohydrolase
MATATRALGELTSPDVAKLLKDASILCLPLGAIEQHGPHLPLNTDVVVAEGLTRRMVARWGETHDLWQLPAVPIGLSREHDWACGTLSVSIQTFTSLLRDLAREIVRALPARNLAFVNGHGGNRGLLECLQHELAGDFGLNCCVIHPFDLAAHDADPARADIHGGKDETSVMLALAPELVRRGLIAPSGRSDPQAVQSLIFGRGASWPWRTDDPRLTGDGVIGDASDATAEFGEAIIARMVEAAGSVFATLRDRQALMRKPQA